MLRNTNAPHLYIGVLCERERREPSASTAQHEQQHRGRGAQVRLERRNDHKQHRNIVHNAVSYTHLTLPTIYSV